MREGNRQLEITTAALPSVQSGEPAWTWAWLYVWQWLLMAVWAWTLIGVHVANAGLRLLGSGDGAPLPAPDLGVLMSLTTLYMGLHMGGHTVLELMRGRWGGVFERGKGGPA
jgi:hypothetical protein